MKLGASTENPVVTNPVSAASVAKAGKATNAPLENTGKSQTPAAPSRSSSGGVPVSVSSLTRALVQPTADDLADIDQKKVEDIRASIENGSFKVNAGAIADKMLANAQEMLNRRKG